MFMLISSPTAADAVNDDLAGVNVGVYNGTGEMDSSRIALVRMFEWMGASVEEVTASQILGDYLDDCDILVFPGGSENSYMIDLDYITGVEKIREFVENGGSYFGICGGSTFGAKTVRLFDGKMYPVNEPGDIIHMSTMRPNTSSIGPDLSDCPTSFSTMYYASQYFVPTYGTFVHTIATYQYNRQAGMIAFEFGYGTVFLSSPHPEYEEDSDRDDTTFGDDLEDPDSEWAFLLKISRWLIDASSEEPPTTTTTTTTSTTTTTTTTTTTAGTTNESSTTSIANTEPNSLGLPLTLSMSVGGVLVILLVTILYRRNH
jgi:glutamine amidotransferase-like uncharacterized protein